MGTGRHYEDTYLSHLEPIAAEDIRCLNIKDRQYEGSWNKRPYSAFENLSRKWDRLNLFASSAQYDLFGALNADANLLNPGEDGTVLAEIRDLRRYLLLVEAKYIQNTLDATYENQHAALRKVYDETNEFKPYTGHEAMSLVEERAADALNEAFGTPRPGTPEDGGQHGDIGDGVALTSMTHPVTLPFLRMNEEYCYHCSGHGIFTTPSGDHKECDFCHATGKVLKTEP